MKKRKLNLSGIAAFIIALIVLAIFIPINIIANYYDKNFDMTPNKKYTLTDTTLSLLDETKDKSIELYFLWSLEELRDVAEFLPLYHTLNQLEEYDNITLTAFKPDENPDLVNKLNPSGSLTVNEGDLFIKCGDIIRKINANRFFPYDSNEVVSYAGEELISGAIKIVTSGSLPTIYFLTGHGEKTINDNYSTISGVFKADNYDVNELDLNDVDAVPDNAAIVILAGPQNDISDDEKEKLLSYANDGGALSFMIAPVDTNGRFTNIEDVLETYELGIDYNIVKENDPERQLNNKDFEQDAYVFKVTYPPATDEFTEDLTTEINMLVEEGAMGGISNTRSLYQINNASASQYIEKSSIITNTSFVNESFEEEWSTISEPMGGNVETVKEANDLNNMQLELGFYSYNKQTGSKMIALGTTDLIDQEAVSASVSLTQQLLLHSITWQYNSDINMEIGNKATSYDYMAFPSAEKASSTLRIFWITPICIALIGLLVWLKRRHS